MGRGAQIAVISTLPLSGVAFDYAQAVPLIGGMAGVAVARMAFVEREFRRTNRRQSWKETLSLTAIAMLFASAIIVEKSFQWPWAVFTGLASGWLAVTIPDVLGDKLLAAFGASKTGIASLELDKIPLDPTPDEFTELLKRMDRMEDEQRANTRDHGLKP